MSHPGTVSCEYRIRARLSTMAALEVTAAPAPQGEPLPFEATTSGSGNEPLKVSVALAALDD